MISHGVTVINIYQACCFVQDADSIILVLDDGFNLVQYAFKLRSSGSRQTLVECQVDPASILTSHADVQACHIGYCSCGCACALHAMSCALMRRNTDVLAAPSWLMLRLLRGACIQHLDARPPQMCWVSLLLSSMKQCDACGPEAISMLVGAGRLLEQAGNFMGGPL